MRDFTTIVFGNYTIGYFFGLLFFTYIGIIVSYGIRRMHAPLTVKAPIKWMKTITNALLAIIFVRFSTDLIKILPLDVLVGEDMSNPFTAFIFGLLIDYISFQIYNFVNNPKSVIKMSETKTIVFDLIENLNEDVIHSLDQECVDKTAAQLVASSRDKEYEIVVGSDKVTYLIKNNAVAEVLVVMRRPNGSTYQFTTVDFVGKRPVGR